LFSIRALHNVPEIPEYSREGPRADISMGIFEKSDTFMQIDLDLFFANFTPRIPKGGQPTLAFIDGSEITSNSLPAKGAFNLDFELAYLLIYPQSITLYQTDDVYYVERLNFTSGIFNTFLDAVDGASMSQ
jgi:tripeptidyl-peptidase-1